MKAKISYHHKYDFDTIETRHDNAKGIYWSEFMTNNTDVVFFYSTPKAAAQLAHLFRKFADQIEGIADQMPTPETADAGKGGEV